MTLARWPTACRAKNKALPLPVAETKNFEDCFFVPMFQFVTLGGASFDAQGTIPTNLVEVHMEMLYTKYQSSMPSSFREEKF